ncbi:flagellar hook-basal body complex protein FliE [Rhizosaccharibacter radicis]|uniref:Flagellar hook-basal body complex protein FliE n=1 Tax=Rhizosaccharibacter radicis TaxID=2782605 RepID=A0ABT1W122_9PROT|nr:flagellar hook-basal body complex protein FliE [Acetobacteraceae bacterium KSS12]
MIDARMLATTPSAAATAYARTQDRSSLDGIGAGDGLPDFGSAMQDAIQGVVQAGHTADAEAAKGLTGSGNVTDVVMAVSRAQMALQSTTVIRDRVVQAYQDIMKMSI